MKVARDLQALQVDDKRRVILPKTCPPRATVTIEQLDTDTWLVKRHRPSKGHKIVLFPDIPRLSDDPEWEKEELAISRHCSKKVPPFEE
jgi:hypothetical protein